MRTCIRSNVAKKIREILYKESIRQKNNIIALNSYDIIKYMIKKGAGSCSTDRYLRAMRQMGEINYMDPRKMKHIYYIRLNSKFFKRIKK